MRSNERMLRRIAAMVLLMSCRSLLLAQTFDLEQFDQVFRPRLRVDTRFTPQIAFKDTTGSFGEQSAQAVLTFPMHSTWSVGVQVDGNSKSLGDLLKNSVRVKAGQLLGNVRFGARQVHIENDPLPDRTLYTASIGAMRVALTKSFHIRFWSANVNVSEEDKTFSSMVPRISGVLGWVHVKGLKRYHFYGLAASYSDGLALPVPFFGGNAPLGGDWAFHYVLPVQLALAFKPEHRLKYLAGITLDGFRSGFERDDARLNFNYTSLRAFANVRYKLNNHFTLRTEAGYAPWQSVRFTNGTDERSRYVLDPGFSFMFGVNILFGESMLDRIMDEVIK